MREEDIKNMRFAIKLASKGLGKTSPNPCVGAVVVKNGRVAGSGYHKFGGGPHAEVYALKQAGKKAKGAIL
jgi:diaminohydroxyphosphoribosylaminopyrimidine deaminase/5-amino-6-(5-phosphoribosylamino)uracil reductase